MMRHSIHPQSQPAGFLLLGETMTPHPHLAIIGFSTMG
jgi:hypothetical protein